MEFPEGMRHYFNEKVCSFHYWFLFVRPRKEWEDYLTFARADGASAGYHLTLPPDEVIKTAILGDVPPVVNPASDIQSTQTSDTDQGQTPGSNKGQTTVQPNPLPS
jgi:hypothetical protein